MSEVTVPMDDAALFNAATSETAPEAPAVETPQAQPEQPDAGPARDEAGRFAPKTSDAKPAETVAAEQPPTTPQAPPEPAHIPAWRLSEVSEARRQAEARANQAEAAARRFEAQLRQYTEKPAEPIDPYADPEKFADHRVKQAVDPVARQMAETREYYSRKDAIRTHGMETVQAAYKWLETATHAGDPRVAPLLQRVTSSIDPFEDVVSAYKRDKAISTVGDDPNVWWEKEFERRKADPEFAAKYLTPPQANAQGNPNNIVRLPPSLNRQSGAADNASAGSMNDADLFAQAIRK